MKESQTTKLINEHQEIMSKLRHISNKLLNLVDGTLAEDEGANAQLARLNLKQKETMQLFFRVSSLLLKAIPTELQINAAKLDKSMNFVKLSEEEKKANYISPKELAILQNYFARYEDDTKL